MRNLLQSLCCIGLTVLASNVCWADPRPTRVTTVYDVTSSESDLFGDSITSDTLLGAINDVIYPWEQKVEKLRDAYQGREVAGQVGRFLEVGYYPNPDDPDPDPWPWWKVLWPKGGDPHPNWQNLNEWGDGAVGYWVDPPDGPTPIDPWAASDVLETLGILTEVDGLNLQPGQFALLRSRMAFEPGAMQQISQEAAEMIPQSKPGDGLLVGGAMDLLLFDPEQQGYKSLMTAELSSYSLKVAGRGDADVDGDVDGMDFLVTQRGAGSAFASNDLKEWSERYGQAGASLANISNVPEPASLTLLALSAASLLLGRSRTCG